MKTHLISIFMGNKLTCIKIIIRQLSLARCRRQAKRCDKREKHDLYAKRLDTCSMNLHKLKGSASASLIGPGQGLFKYALIFGSTAYFAVVSTPARAISQGQNDNSSDLQANSVVIVGSPDTGCTGTLIGSRLVVTAGHCMGAYSGRVTPVTNRWINFSTNPQVTIGNRRTSPFTVATAWQWGVDDIWVLRLRDPVPPDMAEPVTVLTRFPRQVYVGPGSWQERVTEYLKDQRLTVSSWGPTNNRPAWPTFRQTAAAEVINFPDLNRRLGPNNNPDETLGPIVVLPNTLEAKLTSGGLYFQGDSGSPLFMMGGERGSRRYLIGVLQQEGGHYISTFGAGGTDQIGGNWLNLADWFDNILYQDIINNTSHRNIQKLRLISWFSPNRGDNFATTDRRWAIPVSRIKRNLNGTLQHLADQPSQDGYQGYRFEGYVFSPRHPQPQGTVPLWSWWNPATEDNYATTRSDWGINLSEVEWQGEHIVSTRSQRGYRLYRLEGFIYDPREPQPPDTIPLFTWWNPSTGDHFLTSDPNWGIAPSSIEWNGDDVANNVSPRSNYRLLRMEGYILPPLL